MVLVSDGEGEAGLAHGSRGCLWSDSAQLWRICTICRWVYYAHGSGNDTSLPLCILFLTQLPDMGAQEDSVHQGRMKSSLAYSDQLQVVPTIGRIGPSSPYMVGVTTFNSGWNRISEPRSKIIDCIRCDVWAIIGDRYRHVRLENDLTKTAANLLTIDPDRPAG